MNEVRKKIEVKKLLIKIAITKRQLFEILQTNEWGYKKNWSKEIITCKKYLDSFTNTISHLIKCILTRSSGASAMSFKKCNFNFRKKQGGNWFKFWIFRLLRLQETGVINREQILFFFPKPIPDYTKPIFFSMDISDTKFIFSVLIIGFLLSAVIFLVEIITFKINHYRIDVWMMV